MDANCYLYRVGQDATEIGYHGFIVSLNFNSSSPSKCDHLASSELCLML